MAKKVISNEYAAIVMIEMLYEKGLINKATLDEIKANYPLQRLDKKGGKQNEQCA